MKKLLFLFLLLTGFVNAQQEAFTIKNPYRDTELKPKETFVIEDEKTGNFAVFMIAGLTNYAFLYDKDFNKLKHIKSPKLPGKYKSFQGYTIKDNTYSFLMNTSNNRSYGVITFDFEKGSYETYESAFKLKKERLLSVVSYKNTCYLITISKKENEIIIYSFNENWDEPNRRAVVFDDDYFKDATNKKFDFNELFYDKFQIQTIRNENPISIKEASRRIKIYNKKTDVQIISNNFKEKTFILDFNLVNEGQKVSSIEMPVFEKEGYVPESNSFLIDNKIFQVRANNLKLAFNIVDLNNGEVINQFNVRKEDSINFINSPIIQKKTGIFEGERNINSTTAFLRKLQVMDLGISVYKDENNYVFHIGGYYEDEPNSSLVVVSGGNFTVGFVAGLATSFLTYNYSKSLMIEGLLDENLKHQDGRIKENVFERISNFSSRRKLKAETLFNKDETFYWGNYSSKYDHYSFFSFRN
ncbi:MAG: hypothetical protein ACSHW7_02120 [Patiriisocius sp.]|uniref:hypothetical protein n=1 Tax=Patiriisocius sp. TaxID=2822396 RepID=UPI003EF41C07